MYFNFGKIFRVILLLLVGAALGIGVLLAYQHFKAPKQTVSVVGTGEVNVVTDQATISIQVTNKKDAQTLKDSLIKLGIPESRITQSSYTGPIFQTDTSSPEMVLPQPVPTGTVTINFTVVLDSLKNIEKVYSVINANPNTQITDTSYSLNNMKDWETKAKKAALNDARAQVESVAKINHLTVGKLISITDNSSQPTIEPPTMLKAEGTTNSGTIGQGQSNGVYYNEQTVTITASYNAEYELY